MEHIDVVENFYGVYLLKSLNEKYRGRVYIGFTVDPNRRIKQHNRGKQFGGASRTSQRGPWEMVLVVHGFPSDVSALRFEWAWQHPKKSRRLKLKISNRKSKETTLQYSIRVLFTMLCTQPWKRLPLTIRWLAADAVIETPATLTPPAHMPIAFGSVKSKSITGEKKQDEDCELKCLQNYAPCEICADPIREEDLITCLNPACQGSWHIFCIANRFLKEEQSYLVAQKSLNSEETMHIIPVEGTCPQCSLSLLWGDLINRKKGCYRNRDNFRS